MFRESLFGLEFLSLPPRLSGVSRSRCRTLRCMFRRIPSAMRHGAARNMSEQCAIPPFGAVPLPSNASAIAAVICAMRLSRSSSAVFSFSIIRRAMPGNAIGRIAGTASLNPPRRPAPFSPRQIFRRLRAFSGGLDNRVLRAINRAFGSSRGGNVLTLFPTALYFYSDGRKFF